MTFLFQKTKRNSAIPINYPSATHAVSPFSLLEAVTDKLFYMIPKALNYRMLSCHF